MTEFEQLDAISAAYRIGYGEGNVLDFPLIRRFDWKEARSYDRVFRVRANAQTRFERFRDGMNWPAGVPRRQGLAGFAPLPSDRPLYDSGDGCA